jgi:hypothetical protein
VPYVRTVKTASGATAVQIVYSWHRGSREIDHIGSARDDVELELLKAAAWERLAAGQGELDLGLDAGAAGGPLPITASRMGCLAGALEHAWRVLGFDLASGGDEVFGHLVLARIIEPVSKLDSLRVLGRPGWLARRMPRSSAAFAPMRSRRGGRRSPLPAPPMPGWAGPAWSFTTCPCCISRLTRATGFRESGFSKERRLEPQITIGLLTGQVPAPAFIFSSTTPRVPGTEIPRRNAHCSAGPKSAFMSWVFSRRGYGVMLAAR